MKLLIAFNMSHNFVRDKMRQIIRYPIIRIHDKALPFVFIRIIIYEKII